MSVTRAEFIKSYASASRLSAEYAVLGIIDVGGKTLCALPCACGEEGCQGWAMLSADGVADHLFFRAPDALRKAYREAVGRNT